MRQICGHLPELEQAVSSRETRIAVELLMDTGRRPAEICTLEWDCLARDADGTPVLVYDNSKAHRLHRRLPVSEHTAALITDQKLAVRERFPATPPAQLKLLPSRRLNPDRISPDHRGQPHRPASDLARLNGTAAAGRQHRI
jgi:integrase